MFNDPWDRELLTNSACQLWFFIVELLSLTATSYALNPRLNIQKFDSHIHASRQQCAAPSLGVKMDGRNNFGMKPHSGGTEWTKRLTSINEWRGAR
jgi:hypothetical protein